MIIVTGAAGFIGSNIVRGLNRIGVDDILVVDNLENGEKHINLNTLRFRDYVDKRDLVASLPKFGDTTAIFHQGACSSTTEADGRYMMANNYQFSKDLLHFALERNSKFLYASSAAVYGDGSAGFKEEASCEYPLNVYGYSKLVFDNYVRQLKGNTSQVLGLRYFNVYGPQEQHKGRMASVARHLFLQLKDGGPMKLFEGSAEIRRDFVHIDDVVSVNLHFFESGGSGIFNCGTGSARAFLDIAETLKALHGEGEVEFIPFPTDLKGKYQRFTEANIGSLREAGYDNQFLSLEEGLARYYPVLKQSGGAYR